MTGMKKSFLVLRAALQETFTDKKMIVLLLIIGFILDNGVRKMVDNAIQVQQPIGIFEGFIMCLNHWYYLIIFCVGFIFILSGVPRINSEQILLIYRTGKKDWFFGEILHIAVCAFIYIILLMIGCVVSTAKYGYMGNVWSNFTIYYRNYQELLADSNRYIDQQVYKYYSPYQSVLHGVLLLTLCLTLMGTIVLFCTIMNMKLVGIILNIILIIFVIIFNEYQVDAMWISPYCHAVLALHNVYVFKQLSISLVYSYLYFIVLEGITICLSIRQLKNKMFY